jgi:4-amino-4-deoxy-L-arabinose transferase-like glycosyltransferase
VGAGPSSALEPLELRAAVRLPEETRSLGEAPGAQDPRWSRPALAAVAALAGLLMTWGLARNGYANSYYSSAVMTASRSWSAFGLDSLDPSGLVSLDKPPLSIWMMALSARIFGFSSLSMLLPNALCGIASVVVLHQLVKRSLGPRVAILSALALALTPVVIVVSRCNNPDALLMLLLICAAWAATRAIESGRTRDVVVCAGLLGLAFNTKMLQAFLVLPAMGIAFQTAGPGTPRRRLGQLAIGAATVLAASAAWVGVMMLIPPGHRPWVGDTTSNSWWQLIFGANGVGRLGGELNMPSAGGGRGLLRLFNAQNGGQVAWLLPLAGVGLVTGLWMARGMPRRDPRRAALLLWSIWALVHFAVFALALNLFHPYYTSALAPAIAVLAAAGAVLLWDRAPRSSACVGGLAGAILVTGGVAVVELRRVAGFVPWLAWVISGLAVVAAVAVAARLTRGTVPSPSSASPGNRPQRFGRSWGRLAAVAGIASVLAGPAAYSIATVGHPVTGVDPVAGPVAPQPPAPGGSAGLLVPARGGGSVFGRLPVARPPATGAAGTVSTARLLAYLEARLGSARYLVAATGSQVAAPIMLTSGRPVVTMGGFSGGDPPPSVDQLRRLIATGQLRFVLGESDGTRAALERAGPSLGGHRARARWVGAHCQRVILTGTGAQAGVRDSQPWLYDCAGRG